MPGDQDPDVSRRTDARAPFVLQPRLSAFDASMVVVSLVIGIGIFRTPASVAAATGGAGGFLLAWALGGVISLAGALTFAEIGSRFPRPGAYYKVVAHCVHPLAAFLLNWAQVVMQGAGAAGVAVIGAEYLLRFVRPGSAVEASLGPAASVGADGLAASLLAAGLLGGLLALNALGIRSGARAQNLLSVAKVLLIVGLAVVAFAVGPSTPHPDELAASGAGNNANPAADSGEIPGPYAPPPTGNALTLAGMIAALVSVFYTYGGYQNTINLAGDVREARRNLPRAVVGGMLLVTAVYLTINAAYVHVLGAAGVASATLVAADVARACLGRGGESFVSLAIFLSAAGFVNATILQLPRSYVAMAEDGVLPRALARVNPRTQVQAGGLAFFAATAFVPLLFLGSFDKLVGYVMFTDALSLATVAACVFVLRRRREGEVAATISAGTPDVLTPRDAALSGPFRAPVYPWLPAAFVLCLLAVSVHIALTQPRLALAGGCVIVAGWPLYAAMRRMTRS